MEAVVVAVVGVVGVRPARSSSGTSCSRAGAPGFASGAIQAGDGKTYSVTFNTPGSYSYDCAVHGPAMRGTIVVQ
jgi:plastocyanin